MNFRKSLKPLIYGIVHVILGLGVFLSFFQVSGSLELHYDVGHQVLRKISLILFSSQIDSNLWLLATFLVCLFSAATILAARVDRARYGCLLLGNFLAITLYSLGFGVWGFALSLIVDLAFLFSSHFQKAASHERTPAVWGWVSVATFLLMVVTVESLALASSFANLLFRVNVLGGVVNLQWQLSDLFLNYSPIILVVDLFLWVPLIPIIQKLNVRGYGDENQKAAYQRLSFSLLAFAVLLACFVTILPYVSGIAGLWQYGVDTPYYYSYLNKTNTPLEAVAQIAEPRGLYVALLFGIRAMGFGAIHALIIGPAVLAVLFTVAVYLLTRSLTENYLAAGIASIYGAASVHTLVGMFAGIFANWLVLSFVMFLIFFLNRLYIGWSRRNFLGAILMSYLALVAHPWTWAVMVVVIVTALLYLYVFDASGRHRSIRVAAAFLAACVLPVILVAALGSVLMPGLTSVLDAGFGSLISPMSLVKAGYVQDRTYLLRDYVGGFLAYPQTLLLTLIGILSLPRFIRRASAISIGWLAVTSVFAALASYDIIWRVLYLIPFELFAAMGAVALLAVLRGVSKRSGVKATILCIKIVKVLILALLILDCINFVFKSIPFLPLWS